MGAGLFGFGGMRGECEACGRCREQQARNAGLAVAGEVASVHPAGSGARPRRRLARAVCRPTLPRPRASARPRHAAPAETESCVRGFLTSCASASSRPYTPLMWRRCDFFDLRYGCSVVSCGGRRTPKRGRRTAGRRCGLPVRLGDAGRRMRGDSERVRRLDSLVRRPRRGASVRSAVDPLARISTFVENVRVRQAQGNPRMSAVSGPGDGWARPSVVCSRRERVVGAGAEADLDAAPADVDGGGGGPHGLVEAGVMSANLVFELRFLCRGARARCGGTFRNERVLGSDGAGSAGQVGGSGGRGRSAEGTEEGQVRGQVAAPSPDASRLRRSLREAVVRAGKADLADVGLLKRPGKSKTWLHALCAELFRERGFAVSAAGGFQVHAFDATGVKEPGRTGSLRRMRCGVSLPSLACGSLQAGRHGGAGHAAVRPLRDRVHCLPGRGIPSRCRAGVMSPALAGRTGVQALQVSGAARTLAQAQR